MQTPFCSSLILAVTIAGFSLPSAAQTAADSATVSPAPVESLTVQPQEPQVLDTADTRSAAIARAYGIRDIRQMRQDAERLRREADRIRDMADDLSDESDKLEDNADDLNDKAENSRDAIEDASELAGDSIAMVLESDSGTPADTFAAHAKVFIARHKEMMSRIQESATELLQKSKEIALRVREMEEAADHREELADSLDQKAEDLDPTPYTHRFPLAIGFSGRISSIGPYNDHDAHLFMMSGLKACYTFTDMVGVGISDIGFSSVQTIRGDRYAIGASPYVEISYTLLKRMQLGIDVGGHIQGRFGSKQPEQGAIAPFVSFFNRNWAWKHFSLGPFYRLNYAAYGPQFTVSNRSGILPEGALWSDVGMDFVFNF